MNIYIALKAKNEYLTELQMKTKSFIEKCSGEKCLLTHFTEIRKGEIETLNPTSIMFGGGSVPFKENHGVLKHAALKKLIFDWDGPKLAICYSYLLNVLYHGGQTGDIGKMELGDYDPNPVYHPNKKKESGVFPVYVNNNSELFAGLGKTIMVAQNHKSEIKKLPEGFTSLAKSDLCQYQAYKVDGKPFFGVQFHPERESVAENYPDGSKIMQNFFKFARNYWKSNEGGI